MSKMSKKSVSIIVMIIAVAMVYCFKAFLAPQWIGSTKESPARIKGSKNAPVKIVEFIDFQCPACANGAKYLKQFMEDHPGQIHLEMKYFPLSMHAHAFMSSRYAQCAAYQGKFWLFHDALIDRQSQWSRMINAQPAFDIMANEVALNPRKLEACLKDSKTDEAVNQDKIEGQALGIKSTPTYFINGEMIVGTKSLKAGIIRLLEESKN